MAPSFLDGLGAGSPLRLAFRIRLSPDPAAALASFYVHVQSECWLTPKRPNASDVPSPNLATKAPANLGLFNQRKGAAPAHLDFTISFILAMMGSGVA